MSTKLTLALDASIVRKAKKYAKKQKLSLSKMVEFYFSSLVAGNVEGNFNIPPITAELSGMVKTKVSGSDKQLLTDALIEKYL